MKSNRTKKNKVVIENETKSDKFKRIVKVKMPKILNGIRNLKPLAKIEFTEEQKTKIINDIIDEVNKINEIMTEALIPKEKTERKKKEKITEYEI